MNQTNIKTIIKKELKSYFNSPTAYIVMIVFLLVWEFLFFRSVFLFGEASLRLLVGFLPWLFILFIPALTMGSISEEKANGTLEILLTHPLGILELILGKFLATLFYVALTLAFMFPVAYSLDRFGSLDWGVVLGQYSAAILLAALMVSLGLFVSSLFSSQIASMLVASTASFFFIISGFEIVTLSLPSQLATIFERLSFLTHYESMARGVIDTRDLVYFASGITIFTSLCYLQILRDRIGNQKPKFRQYQLATYLFIIIAILTNIVGNRIPGRLDLTQEKVYQLSDTTVDTLKNLDDVVNIQLFATSELPAQLRPILRDIKDTLRDYQTFADGKVTVSIKDPNQDNQAKTEASSVGIQEVQFNVVDQDQLQVKRGYLGLAVSYGGKSEVIPLIRDTSDLEYQLTSFIRKLTSTEQKTIGFLSGHGEKSPQGAYSSLAKELEKQFTVDEVFLDEENPSISDNISALVIGGPDQPIEENDRQAIASYIDNGGSALFLLDGISVNESLLSATINENSLADFIATYGVNLGFNLVYDLRSSETVNFGGNGNINYLLRYPFWPRALAADPTSPLTSRINSIVLPWPSTVAVDPEKLTNLGLSATTLFVTTEAGGVQTANFNIRPDQNLINSDLAQQTLAVSLTPTNPQAGSLSRIIVIGDSDFLTDQFTTSSPENLAFGINALSWLSQEESLAQIQLKQRTTRPLLFQDETQPQLIKYSNLIIAFAIPFIFGTSRMIRRRNLRKFKYSSQI